MPKNPFSGIERYQQARQVKHEVVDLRIHSVELKEVPPEEALLSLPRRNPFSGIESREQNSEACIGRERLNPFSGIERHRGVPRYH